MPVWTIDIHQLSTYVDTTIQLLLTLIVSVPWGEVCIRVHRSGNSSAANPRCSYTYSYLGAEVGTEDHSFGGKEAGSNSIHSCERGEVRP